jgi:2-oxo-4-hydroxy-4-carboxy-5-ureidoimidazoline decarboxylase
MPLSIAAINALPREEFVQHLGGVFEHSPWVAEAAFGARPFADVTGLHAAMLGAVRHAPFSRQLAFLRGHPELAGKAMVAGALTADSSNEQTRSGLTQCSPEEFAKLQELNAAYGARFGWPFILAVKHLDRATIIKTFGERLGASAADEFEECIANIGKITRWRLDDLIGAQ